MDENILVFFICVGEVNYLAELVCMFLRMALLMPAVFQSSDPRAHSHTLLTLKRFFHHHHHHHLTVALEDMAITLPFVCSHYQYSLPPIFVLSGTLLQVCWCMNSQWALSFPLHTFTPSLHKKKWYFTSYFSTFLAKKFLSFYQLSF